MAGRYLVSGVQLGLLLSITDAEERKKIIKDIIDKQFVGNSNQAIIKDVEEVANITLGNGGNK